MRKKKFKLYENVYGIAIDIFDRLQINYSTENVKNFLDSHPNYPSLLSLSDLLSYFGIENMVLSVSTHKLHEVPIPFVAHVKDHEALQNKFTLVYKIDCDNIFIYDTQKGFLKESFDVFKYKYGGSCLLIEAKAIPDSNLHVTNRALHREFLSRAVHYLAPAILFFLAVAAAFSVQSAETFYLWTLLVSLKGTGLLISIGLITKEYKIGKWSTGLLNEICTFGLPASSFSCDTALESKVSNLFGFIRLSELSLIYFGGGLICVLLSGMHYFVSIVSALYMITCLSLPLTIFLLYYQVKVLKRLCVLCISIQMVLWFEFVLLHSFSPLYDVPSLNDVSTLVFSYVLMILFWFSVEKKVQKAGEWLPLTRKLNYFLYNPELVGLFLRKNCPAEQGTFGLSPDLIIGGSNDASIKVTAILNLYCEHCRNEFANLIEMSNRPNVLIGLSFVSNSTIVETETLRHVLCWILQNRSSSKILRNWYSKYLNLSQLRKLYPIAYDHCYEMAQNRIVMTNKWTSTAGLTSVPTIIINDCVMPPELKLYDLDFYIRTYRERTGEPISI